MQPISGNQRPDLRTSLMNMSLVLRLPREVHLSRSSSNVPRLPSFSDMLQTLTFCSLLARCKISCACHAERHLNVKKVVPTCGAFNILTSTCASRHNDVHFFDISTSKKIRTWCALCILTWKCASCHNGVHFFDISTSQNAPKAQFFSFFHLQMCFVPQQRALFRHLNFQKWSEAEVFCTC